MTSGTEQPRVAAATRGPWTTALILGGAFFIAYLGFGLVLSTRAPRLFARLDLAFDADLPSRIIDLTRLEGAHYRTQLHPLFVLLLNPLGLALRGALRALGAPQPGRLAAIVLTSAAGAAAVALSLVLLRRWLTSAVVALLWAVMLGLTSSHLVFAALPETFMFSALSLIVVFLVVADPVRSGKARLGASVACFGMAVTNLAAVFLVRVDGARHLGWRRALLAAGRLTALTVAVGALLAALQLSIYSRTVPFYRTTGVARDDRLSFYWPASASEGVRRLAEVAAHLLLFNVSAPRLQTEGAGTEWPKVDFPAVSWKALRPSGMAHAPIWLAVLALGGVGLSRRTPLPPPAGALLLWLVLHVLLQSVFGHSLFLYSCQWTFGVLALAALGLERWAGRSTTRRRLAVLSISVLLALQVWSNGAFLVELSAVYE
jgi:hypothetical protein